MRGVQLKVPLVLPRCLPEPAAARVIEGALLRVAEQAGDLAEMEPGFGEVSRRSGPPFRTEEPCGTVETEDHAGRRRK